MIFESIVRTLRGLGQTDRPTLRGLGAPPVVPLAESWDDETPLPKITRDEVRRIVGGCK